VDEIRPALNFGDRVNCVRPDILLLHYTGMDSAAGALKWLCCKESGVSCHYFVFEDGRTVQLVPECKRAHHAGAGSWKGESDVNSRSVGIEIANAGHQGGLPNFTQAQMESVARLSADIIERHGIKPEMVLAHSDIAPLRKEDPGEKFDWIWLADRGVGHCVAPTPLTSGMFLTQGDRGEPVEALQSMLALYGYGIDINGVFDDLTGAVVRAFQRHFRQEKVDGVADRSTIDTLHALLKC